MTRKGECMEDRIFNIFNYTILFLVLITVLYPLIFIVIASISDPNAVYKGEVLLIPKGINFDGYIKIFNEQRIWLGYRNTIIYTIVGTIINLFLTITAAYSLSRKEFYLRTPITIFISITMFFSGGLIPSYLVVKNLGILNSIWAMVLPNAVAVWNIIITRTYFQTTIPDELYDAASIDGCNRYNVLLRIILPLSLPIIAVIGLFYGVSHWNDYFTGLLYITDEAKYPLQVILRSLLIQNEVSPEMMKGISGADMIERQRIAESIKYGVIIVGSLPVLLVYPFIQKFFVKGVMIGSLKG